ncbi:hypothetical protein [Hoeflea sp.]|uniref:hypothetical protein n=1 Tax=Hoeflea sp. TaxID=1940281 RepID=UPI00198D088F|nr:hypothetical protein [Hoeflea sp.]MBC7284911.1 hypothetical protein [Hoeflea sp.]
MIGHALIFAHAALVQVPSGEPPAGPFQAERVPDSVLAAQRGGLRLPGGIDVHLSIDTVTAVDGRIVLQTVTRIAEGSPVVSAYAPAEGQSVAPPEARVRHNFAAPGCLRPPARPHGHDRNADGAGHAGARPERGNRRTFRRIAGA